MLIDSALPRWDFREVHTLVVAAPPEAVWTALGSLTPNDIPVARFLLGLRSLPARLRGNAGLDTGRHEPVLTSLNEKFVPLAEAAGEETVSGAVGQWWKPTVPFVSLDSPEHFHQFDRPGYLKAAVTFRATSHAHGTLLLTETRVVALDHRTRRLFRPYWYLLARPFGGLIRRAWLRAVGIQAEATRRG
ncbi:hypothetical protein OHS70_25995 [Streptomyces sp. NBC_00390]|uniref:hypothetical protein n=1 Tax=Streptomyces sp. NBC_00390 TaxID=2975736 RepID=UPI002E1D6EAE